MANLNVIFCSTNFMVKFLFNVPKSNALLSTYSLGNPCNTIFKKKKLVGENGYHYEIPNTKIRRKKVDSAKDHKNYRSVIDGNSWYGPYILLRVGRSVIKSRFPPSRKIWLSRTYQVNWQKNIFYKSYIGCDDYKYEYVFKKYD